MTTLTKKTAVPYRGFGPSILATQTREKPAEYSIPKDRLAARTMLHEHCPLSPGIYGWIDHQQQICYIGKSKSLRKRLLSYFAKTPSDKKTERIRQHSETLAWEPISDELLALIREQELIYRWRPEFNTQGQPTKRQPAFICISNGPAPNAFFTRSITRKSAYAFGPVAGTGQLRESVESINQSFLLRDCPDSTKIEFNNQPQLFENPLSAQCIRLEIGSCPGPCAASCSRSEYHDAVEQATEFIRGNDRSILNNLKSKMDSAASNLAFEKASVFRDHLDNLQWLDRRMTQLRIAQHTFNGILPIPALGNRTVWLVLKAGRLITSFTKPNTTKRAITAVKRLAEIADEPARLPSSIFEMNLQLIIMAWLRKYPKLKDSLIPFDSAIETCEILLCDK